MFILGRFGVDCSLTDGSSVDVLSFRYSNVCAVPLNLCTDVEIDTFDVLTTDNLTCSILVGLVRVNKKRLVQVRNSNAHPIGKTRRLVHDTLSVFYID